MNTLDIILAVPLLYGLYKGFTRGLIIEIASLVGLVLGIYGGVHFSHKTAAVLGEHVNLTGNAMELAAFIVTFLLILGAVYFIAKMLEKVVNLVAMKLLNKAGGAVFGILKMALILSVFLIVVEALDQRWEFIPKKQKNTSYLYAPTASIAPLVVPVFKDSDWYSDFEIGNDLPDPPEFLKFIPNESSN